MSKLSYNICEPYYGGRGCWYIYDSYLQMLIHLCRPGYKTKAEAIRECRKINNAYKSLGIVVGDTYKTKPLSECNV